MSITVAPTATISVELNGTSSVSALVDLAFDAMPGRLIVSMTVDRAPCAIFLEFTADQLAALMNELVAVSELVTS